MMIDGLWYQLDQLVNLDAHCRILKSPSPSLLDKIRGVKHQLVSSPKLASDFLALRDGQLPSSDLTTHKAGWIAARVFSTRPWCVGMNLIHSRSGQLSSPIVEQLAMLGHRVDETAAQIVGRRWRNSSRPFHAKVDAVCLPNLGQKIGTVVKAISYSSLISSDALGADAIQHEPEGGCFLKECLVPSAMVNTLVRSRELLESACPSIRWQTYLLVVGDQYSWQYQLHDFSNIEEEFATGDKCLIDSLFVGSSLRYREEIRKDPDFLQRVPNDTWRMSLPCMLKELPLDRYTRSMILLSSLFDHQEGEHRLAALEATELHKLMEQKFGLVYPKDMRRHDLEDCLRAGGWARRLPHRKNAYAITHTGVSRCLVMLHKYNKMTPISTPSLLDAAFEQLRRWTGDAGDSFGFGV